MAKIYKNQGSLKLTLETDVTLTGASTTQIKYIKPDQTTGAFTATIDGTEDMYYDFANEDLDTIGDWTFWAYVVFSDSRYADGEPVTIRVYEPGN